MRHRVFGQRLGRDTNARRALLNNLASGLFVHGQITTSIAKAKFARGFVEKLITESKKNRLFLNRHLALLLTKEAFDKLVSQIGPGFKKRQGGYTRIVRLNRRRGDAAPQARLELMPLEPKEQKAKKETPKDKIVKKSKEKKTMALKTNLKK